MLYAIFYGGHSYAVPTEPETFPHFKAATDAFRDRVQGHDRFYPCVDSSAVMHLYHFDPRDDGAAYPDVELSVGPRGGVRWQVC